VRDRRFAAFLVAFVALYAWRMSGVLPVAPITDHLSNLYLTGAALTLAIGPRGFGDPRRQPLVRAVAAVLVAVNLVAEVLVAAIGLDDELNDALGNVNTSDPVDGLFGLAAVAAVLAATPWRHHDAAEVRPAAPDGR
jgi:hypothetical protein